MQLKSLIFLFFANIYTVRFDAGMKAGANDLVVLLSNRGLLIFLVLRKPEIPSGNFNAENL